MGKYWLISVPSGGNKQEKLGSVKNTLGPSVADVYPFMIPDLKVLEKLDY
jgi:hypothetical protein